MPVALRRDFDDAALDQLRRPRMRHKRAGFLPWPRLGVPLAGGIESAQSAQPDVLAYMKHVLFGKPVSYGADLRLSSFHPRRWTPNRPCALWRSVIASTCAWSLAALSAVVAIVNSNRDGLNFSASATSSSMSFVVSLTTGH
jgi:hypothetical protein